MNATWRIALASLVVLLAGEVRPAAAQVHGSSGDVLPAAFQRMPVPVDGQVAFMAGGSWTPLLAVDWTGSQAWTGAWLRADWNRRGLHLSLFLPDASEAARAGAGRAPPAAFQVVTEVEGGAGSYRVSCVPLMEPVSGMTRRLHAYLFNHRPGANARLGETGHVLCHEISLLGILTDSMETRWSAAAGGGLQFEALIPWGTLRLPVPAPGTELPLAVLVTQPDQPAVSWTGGRVRLLDAGGAPAAASAPGLRLASSYLRQPEPLLAAFPLAGGTALADGIEFDLVDTNGRVRSRANPPPQRGGDAVFATLDTRGLQDGAYTVRVSRESRSLATRSLRLVGGAATADIDGKIADLGARLDRVEARGLDAPLRGHAARARRILELGRLPARTDSAALARSLGLIADADAMVGALEMGQRPDAAHEGFDHPAGFAADGRRGPVTFVPVQGEVARLTVHTDRAVDWRLTPLLYGTFSEPVWYDRPIYSFLYAQRLRNPSFEFGHPSAEETVQTFAGYQELEAEGAEAALAGRWLPRVAATLEQVAAPWIGVGRGDVTFAVDCDAYNDRQCQRIRAGRRATDAGVAQVVDLPAWRTTGYQLRGFVRSDGSVTTARAVLYHDGRPVDSATLAGIGREWTEFTAELQSPRVEGPRNAFMLALLFDGPGVLDVDMVTLYPDDTVLGFDPQAVAQLRELDTGWMRWPGGNYASDYHWRDGVGPKDLRPSTPNPSWLGLNPNSVGTDEILQLGEHAGFEVMITVNAGSGTAEEAARWVEYVNGDTTTVMGRMRARNGRAEPYNVRYWNIGNELWGHWQVGYTNPEEHARRYAAFAQAMRAADPSIRIIANAHGGHSESPPEPWNRPLLDHFADQLDILDIHTYVSVPGDAGQSAAEQGFLLSAIPFSYEQWIAEFRQDLLRRDLAHVDVIVGEYNASIRSGDARLNRVADLLAYAAYLHGFIRQGEYMVGANATEYSPFNPRALPFGRMHPRYDLFRTYAAQAGTAPVEATLETPVRQQPHRVGRDVLPIFNLPIVDAVAMLDPKDGSLGISLLNRNMEDAVPVEIRLDAFGPRSQARWFIFDGSAEAGLREETLEVGGEFRVVLPPHSVSLLKLQPASPAVVGEGGRRVERDGGLE
jgi:alpha-L-arabinofuranosidase